MIKVQVKLFATLRRYVPGLEIGEATSVELPEGATVEDLLRHLQLPEKQVKVIFVNAVVRDGAYTLAEGDEVGVFPPVGGG